MTLAYFFYHICCLACGGYVEYLCACLKPAFNILVFRNNRNNYGNINSVAYLTHNIIRCRRIYYNTDSTLKLCVHREIDYSLALRQSSADTRKNRYISGTHNCLSDYRLRRKRINRYYRIGIYISDYTYICCKYYRFYQLAHYSYTACLLNFLGNLQHKAPERTADLGYVQIFCHMNSFRLSVRRIRLRHLSL